MNGLDPARIKQDPLGQGRLARIDVSRDADVAPLDIFFGGEMATWLEEEAERAGSMSADGTGCLELG